MSLEMYLERKKAIGEISFKNLCELIKEDWHLYQKDWTLPGFRAVLVCRFGQWSMGLNNRFIRFCCNFIYRVMYRRVRNVYGIELPQTVKIGRRFKIEHQGAIVVHGYVEVGDDCTIRQGVTLGNRHFSKPYDCPVLKDHVNIGAGAKVLGKVVLSDYSNVGANAVVLNDVLEKTTVVGIPAKPLG